MFEAGINPYQLTFWLLPVLTTPFFWHQKSVWKSITLVFALGLVGWALLVWGEFWFEEQIYRSLTDEQRLNYQDGVAGEAFAFIFGFPFSLIYTFIWLIGTKLVAARWKRTKRTEPRSI